MYKIHNNILPCYFINLFTINLNIHDHFTRQASKFHITSHHTNVRANSIQVYGTNFGTVYPKTLQIQHFSQYLKNDVLSLCIKPLKFEFIFSYYCNLCFPFFLFYFVFYVRYVFFSVSIIFLLRIPTIKIYIYIDIFNCYVCNLATIMFICTDFIEVDD